MADLTYSFDYALSEAVFLERPNRFVSILQHPDSPQPEKAHVPDPGRLKELLIPSAPVLTRDHGIHNNRKLRYSLEMVDSNQGRGTRNWVSVNTQLPNRLIKHCLKNQLLPGFETYRITKPEVRYGESRIDFLLENTATQTPCLLEVKSVTLAEDGDALFPDAPTQRGTRHIEELTAAQQNGYESRILFIIQREDVVRFLPNQVTDPALARALQQAILSGVGVSARRFKLTPTGCCYSGDVPVVIPKTV